MDPVSFRWWERVVPALILGAIVAFIVWQIRKGAEAKAAGVEQGASWRGYLAAAAIGCLSMGSVLVLILSTRPFNYWTDYNPLDLIRYNALAMPSYCFVWGGLQGVIAYAGIDSLRRSQKPAHRMLSVLAIALGLILWVLTLCGTFLAMIMIGLMT